MSDLPSRKEVAGWEGVTVASDGLIVATHERYLNIKAILYAYAEGRLVDREAINYEAAAIAWIGPKDAYDDEPYLQAKHDVLVASVIEQTVKPMFAAAIGDTK